MFTLALLTGRLWSYWRFHQVVNTHTHTQSCKFFGYQQVEYWHPLWWLHTISTDHKANRRRTRVGVTGLSFTRWKTQPWLHVSVYSCRVAMTTCHAGCSAMPWHFHTSGKHTHTHTFSQHWWMFRGRVFLWQELKHSFSLTKAFGGVGWGGWGWEKTQTNTHWGPFICKNHEKLTFFLISKKL